MTLANSEGKKEQSCADCICKCCKCLCCVCSNFLFSCFSGGAYTYMSITGRPYCESSWESIKMQNKESQTTNIINFLFFVLLPIIIIGLPIPSGPQHHSQHSYPHHNLHQARLVLQSPHR